ncbi:Subunit of the glycosylphosphatidylinositol transamidase complex-like protein [Cladophialophora chaetospira]|uniref:Subunit of the glycosylphosphatidylinositol transamidase complex-like protein n=1 Tax=Cladophialophora chaetospira TaxID=386627 RepID=A0AA38XIL4_9EURO|nr:Subunit of the glycosylphosphatidylinositol transamidase complex-like protein [Cladophialophora chaetospira]
MSRSLLLLLPLALLALTVAASDYYERLTLTPLPLGSLLASFDFRSNESLTDYEAQNFRYFPRSLGQALRHADTKELHLRFTTGRWDPETWGARPWDGTKEGGTGVELWAWIDAETEDEAFLRWTTLAQSLSGLFCASLNFIDSTRTTKPVQSFRPAGTYNSASQNLHLLHGVLPGEVVCTENLTPFLKLLPCKGKAGISSLLDGHKVFDASWQSMAIDVRPKCSSGASECQIEIAQTIDVVLDIERSKRPRDNPIPRPIPHEQLVCDETKPYHSHDTCYPRDMVDELSWSLKDVFGRTMAGTCPLADDDSPDAYPVCLNVPHDRTVLVGHSGFEIKSDPGPDESRCYSLLPAEDFDLEVPQQPPATRKHDLGHELLRTERTMTGHGAAHGGMRTIITNPSSTDSTQFVYFETLPWFMRPYMHTLKAQITYSSNPFGDSRKEKIITDMYYRPAIDRRRGTHLELLVSVPPLTTISLTYSFEKSILRYTEYPPDANRGFNIPAAVIRILSPTLHDSSGQPREVFLRTTSLLLPLPTPDFSMPYNVIILTSTVMALAFGSIYNLLVRRFVGVDEVPEGRLGLLVKRIKGGIVKIKDQINGKKAEKVE